MFVCKICGNEVKTGQAFCGVCGADVVDNYETVCPACGSRNGAGSRYCAKCGGILPVLRKPKCEVCGTVNLPGAKFCVACGAPLAVSAETHSEEEVLDARRVKKKLDDMARERMAAVEKELEQRRKQTADECDAAHKDVEKFKRKTEAELDARAGILEEYREKINELGAEDLNLLNKISGALKDYAVYYADPLSEIDEDDIETQTYVCPVCGTVNAMEVTACSHCGRSKARSSLLLAKGKIRQSEPVKRKRKIIAPPEEDFSVEKTPTLDEFINAKEKPAEKAEEKAEPVKKEETPSDFSGRGDRNGYGYAPYPYAPYYSYGAPYGTDEKGKFDPRQMPPIVQPVAFVPYVTQDQPLVQYIPAQENESVVAAKPMAPRTAVQTAAPSRQAASLSAVASEAQQEVNGQI